MVELAVRMVVSLALVLGLLLLCARLGARRFTGRTGSPLQVLHRQSLSRSSGVAVVSVGGRVLLLGTTDQQVQMLTELDPEEVDVPAGPQAADAGSARAPEGLLGRMAGLVDEPTRWIQPRAARRSPAGPALAAVPAGAPADDGTDDETGSFAAALETELEAATAASPPLSPAQVLLQEERRPGTLAGSVLSPDTWRLAARAVSRRAS